MLLLESVSKIEAVHTGLEFFLKRPYERTFAEIYQPGRRASLCSAKACVTVLCRRARSHGADSRHPPSGAARDLRSRHWGGSVRTVLADGRAAISFAPAGTRARNPKTAWSGIFAKHRAAPRFPHATLTMLGQGPDTDEFKRLARELGIAHRVAFPGEVPFTDMPSYYAYADVFVHASQSETYGNVMGEALWCGTPTVAFADGMGVSAQVIDGENGIMLQPGKALSPRTKPTPRSARRCSASSRILSFARGSHARRSRIARERAHPHVVDARSHRPRRSARRKTTPT